MKLFFSVLAVLLSFPALAETKLTDETQAGIVLTNGNSHTQNYNLTSDTKYSWEVNALELKATYLRASTSGVLSARNWLVGLRYEREFSGILSGFLGQSVEGDDFAGVLQRYNTDLGAKYYIHKREKDFVWFTEAGYRYTNEHNSNGLRKGYQKARLYTEAEKYFSPTTSGKFWVEYVPNFTVSQMWLLNSEASIASALNSTFAIKTAFALRYNNAPVVASAQKADTTLSTSLVAKF